MQDPTENIRREMVESINSKRSEREELEVEYGQVWDTKELTEDFTVESFMAPFIVATQKSTGSKGTLMFSDYPRFYFNWRSN